MYTENQIIMFETIQSQAMEIVTICGKLLCSCVVLSFHPSKSHTYIYFCDSYIAHDKLS